MSAGVPNPVTAELTGQYRGAAFDRSTAAGRMLHNIYNKPGKDSTLDPALAKRLADRRKQMEALEAQQQKPKPVPKSRAYVELPQAPRREYPKYLPPIGRRPLNQIEQNDSKTAEELRKQREEAFLAKRGASAVTEEEKFRLQHKFQFGFEPTPQMMAAFVAKQKGERPVIVSDSASAGGLAGGVSGFSVVSKNSAEKRTWMKRFEELETEIEERKEFLREMDAADGGQEQPLAGGKVVGGRRVNLAAKERRHRIQVELHTLLREMKEIDSKIRQLDAEDDE